MDLLLIRIDAIDSLDPTDHYPTANLREPAMTAAKMLEDAIEAIDCGETADAVVLLGGYDNHRAHGGNEPTISVKGQPVDGDDVYHDLRRILANHSARNAAAGNGF